MADLTLPTPNKTPGDGTPASDTNLIIEAVNTLNSAVENIAAGPQGPQGEPGTPGANGLAATITVVNTATSAPGSNAAVTSSGTPQDVALSFTIPRGETGPTGATGPQGAIGPQGDTGPTGPPGPAINVSDATPSNLGVAAAGSNPLASRGDHVHNMPTAADVGAAPASGINPSAITGTAVITSDARLSDARTPTAHKVSHSTGGTDALVPSDIGAAPATGISPSAITGTAVVTADSRLSDARTPTDGSVTDTKIVAGGLSTTAITGTAVVTADSRLSDARTPTAHKASHSTGGTDALVASDIGAAPASGISPSAITGTAVVTADSRLSDARTPTAHAASHQTGGSDALTLAANQVTGTAIVQSLVDAKGDLLVGTADNTVSRLAVSVTNGYVLTADSAEATGVKWAVAAAPVDDPFPTAMFLGGM